MYANYFFQRRSDTETIVKDIDWFFKIIVSYPIFYSTQVYVLLFYQMMLKYTKRDNDSLQDYSVLKRLEHEGTLVRSQAEAYVPFTFLLNFILVNYTLMIKFNNEICSSLFIVSKQNFLYRKLP